MRRREPTDRELVERYQRGDTSAADELIARHQDHVRAYCFTALDDPDEAEDAVQATFEAVMRRLPTFDGGERIERYMIVTAKGRCLSVQRRRSHPAHQPAALHESHAVVDDVHAIIDDRINLEIILGNLTPRHAELLTERHIEGEPLDVMAQRRDTSTGSVAVMVHRAVSAARLVATNHDMWSILPALVAARLAHGLGRRDSTAMSAAALPATALAVAGVLALGIPPTTSTTPATANDMANPVVASSTASPKTEPTHPHTVNGSEPTSTPAARLTGAPAAAGGDQDASSGSDQVRLPVDRVPLPGAGGTIHQDRPEEPKHQYGVAVAETDVVTVETDEEGDELTPVDDPLCSTFGALPGGSCTTTP